MAMTTEKIYIVIAAYPHEGYEKPTAAYADKKIADERADAIREALAIGNDQADIHVLEVELWR